MKNYIEPGDSIVYTVVGSDVVSGQPVVVGELIGFASKAAVVGADVALNMKGVFSVTKVGSQAWSKGDKIFWDKTNSRFTKTASSDADLFAGYAFEDAGSGAGVTTGYLLMAPGAGQKATVVAAVAGTLTGTVDGTIADIAATAGSCAGGSSPSATNVDSAIATAVASIVTGTNLQLKELQTTLNAALAALKAAGLMDN